LTNFITYFLKPIWFLGYIVNKLWASLTLWTVQRSQSASRTGWNLWTECVNWTITVILITQQVGISMTSDYY